MVSYLCGRCGAVYAGRAGAVFPCRATGCDGTPAEVPARPRMRWLREALAGWDTWWEAGVWR